MNRWSVPSWRHRFDPGRLLSGFEAFYNVAVMPWMFLTPDVQVIGPSQKRPLVNGDTIGTASIGTATVLGFRLQLLL